MSVTQTGTPAQDVPIVRLAERLIYRNRWVMLHDDDVRFANGRTGQYFRVTHGDGLPPAVIMPLVGDVTALVRTWRYGVQSWEWAFPRGNPHGPDPEQTARIEVAEETGAEPLELIQLGRIWPESAHLTCVAYAYAARFGPDALTAEPADSEEIAEIRWLPVRDLAVLIAGGEITDGFTLATYGYWAAWQLTGKTR